MAPKAREAQLGHPESNFLQLNTRLSAPRGGLRLLESRHAWHGWHKITFLLLHTHCHFLALANCPTTSSSLILREQSLIGASLTEVLHTTQPNLSWLFTHHLLVLSLVSFHLTSRDYVRVISSSTSSDLGTLLKC